MRTLRECPEVADPAEKIKLKIGALNYVKVDGFACRQPFPGDRSGGRREFDVGDLRPQKRPNGRIGCAAFLLLLLAGHESEDRLDLLLTLGWHAIAVINLVQDGSDGFLLDAGASERAHESQ